jgi:Flp pilus assembly protein TadG
VVEFALVLPMLLLVALALVQVGLLARDELLLVQAARAGARAAAVDPNDALVRDAAIRSAPGLDPARVGIDVTRSGERGQPVRVAVTYEAPVQVPIVGWLFPARIDLHAGATMRQEYP